MSRPVPYPPTTRAKGWRFELDYERIEASATWALAPAEARPWLLMLWMTAWRQTPCGSLEADDTVIAARIGMPPKLWARFGDVLLRGWWVAEDGRRYHDTISELVLEMMTRRRSEADRKAGQRARKAGPQPPSPTRVPRDTGGTAAESDTDHLPPTSETEERATPGRARVAGSVPEVEDPAGFEPTPGGRICRAIRQRAKFGTGNPGDPRLLALLAQGATEEEFVGVAAEAADKGKSWAWLLTVVERRRADAAAIALKPAAPVTAASDAAERTLRLIQSQQLTPEEYQASLEAKRRVLGDRKPKGVA